MLATSATLCECRRVPTDVCDHVAALLHPLPHPPRRPDDAYHEARERAEQERRETAEQLRLAWDESGADPVLSSLAGLHRNQVEIEATIRALLAYAREYAYPRPYTLVDLAGAAGMSFSGVRTAYHDDEVAEVAARTGLRRPRRPSDRASPAGTTMPTNRTHQRRSG
jgi:hypothetical protein